MTHWDVYHPQFATTSLCFCCLLFWCSVVKITPNAGDFASCLKKFKCAFNILVGLLWLAARGSPHRPCRARLGRRHAVSLLDRWTWTGRLTTPLPQNSSTCSSPRWAMWVTTAPAFEPVLPRLPGLPDLLTACRPFPPQVVAHCPDGLPQTIVTPLLIPGFVDMMSKEATEEEYKLWQFLGDAWNIPRLESVVLTLSHTSGSTQQRFNVYAVHIQLIF